MKVAGYPCPQCGGELAYTLTAYTETEPVRLKLRCLRLACLAIWVTPV